MKTVNIPQTDLNVSQICLGTADAGTPSLPRKAAFELLDAFVASGGNFIDTAHVYSDWIPGTKSTSEKLIGEWLTTTGLRSQIIIATKGGHPQLTTMHLSRLSEADLKQDVDESLEYLQTDTIDLYWLHRDDPTLPIAGIIDALNRLVEAGKIRYFGCSNWTPARIGAALDYSQSTGKQSFVANQPMWSLAAPNWERTPDKTLAFMDEATLAFHKRTRMAAIPYSSQARGFFSKMAESGCAGVSAGDLALFDNDINRERLTRAQVLARQHEVEPSAVVLAYLLCQPFTTIPVIGPKRLDQLHSSLSAAELMLTPEEIAYLEGD